MMRRIWRWLGTAALLVSCLTPAARADSTTAMDQAATYASQRRWPEAADAARRAYEEAPNDYWRIEAGILLARVLEQQHDLPGARQTMARVVPLVRQSAGASERSDALAALERLTFLTGDTAGGQRLATQLVAESHADPHNWVVQDEGRTLLYRFAGMAWPTRAGAWVRAGVAPAGDRATPASLVYLPLATDSTISGVRVSIAYRDGAADAQSLDAAVAHFARRALGSSDILQSGAAVPALHAVLVPPDGFNAVHAERLVAYRDARGHSVLLGIWMVRYGHWQITLDARWQANGDSDASAQAALTSLFKAVRWTAPVNIPREDTMRFMALQKQIEAAAGRADWQQAGRLASDALPLAQFPLELARVYSARGIAASERDDPAAALPILARAADAWPRGAVSDSDDALRNQVLLHAADAAFRQGQPASAIAWMNRDTASAHDGPAWHLDAATGAMRNLATGVVLPPRLGEFLREQCQDDKAYYVRLRSHQRIGVTLLKKSPVERPDQRIPMLSSWLAHSLGLQVLRATQQPFAAAGVDGAQGTFILFHVRRDAEETDTTVNIGPAALASGPRMMGFWVSRRRSGMEIVLRSEWAAGDAQALSAARQAAEAFRWTPTASAGRQ